MNTTCFVSLGVMLATSLLAQPATNPTTAAPTEVQPAKPPSPLSKDTLDRIDKMTSLFDGKTLDGWVCFTNNAWAVKDGAMTSLGSGRGVIYTKNEYGNYRLIFNMRHVSGQPDHQACFLVGRPDRSGSEGRRSHHGEVTRSFSYLASGNCALTVTPKTSATDLSFVSEGELRIFSFLVFGSR